MFSKEESKKLRHHFWVAFGKSYPKKWILYDTKIKGLSLKFHFDLKIAIVSIDVEHNDLERRIELWEKLTSLKSILLEEYISNAIFEDYYLLDNGKEISRIYVELHNVSIHNKNTWQETMLFLSMQMLAFEKFYLEYYDILET
ncbi:MAG: DUF4268 domain-containing protein [Flavobacteriaceae bacterium]